MDPLVNSSDITLGPFYTTTESGTTITVSTDLHQYRTDGKTGEEDVKKNECWRYDEKYDEDVSGSSKYGVLETWTER